MNKQEILVLTSVLLIASISLVWLFYAQINTTALLNLPLYSTPSIFDKTTPEQIQESCSQMRTQYYSCMTSYGVGIKACINHVLSGAMQTHGTEGGIQFFGLCRMFGGFGIEPKGYSSIEKPIGTLYHTRSGTWDEQKLSELCGAMRDYLTWCGGYTTDCLLQVVTEWMSAYGVELGVDAFVACGSQAKGQPPSLIS